MGADPEFSGDDELMPGHGEDSQQNRGEQPPRSREKSLAELARDVAGLEEVCRWQWNLVQRIRGQVDSLTQRR